MSTPKTLEEIIRTAMSKAYNPLEERELESTGDADVDRVAMYLDHIVEREEMLLAIPLMFRKIMAYEDHNVTTGEFRDALMDSFPNKDDAVILFNVLSKVGQHDDEQDEEDRDDERLADKDKEASRREHDHDKGAQSLADRRHESEGSKKHEGLTLAEKTMQMRFAKLSGR